MKEFTVAEIGSAVGGKLAAGSGESIVRGFSIDSREIRPQMMFFAIVGENNDGHDFIEQVIEKGCRTIAVSDESKGATGGRRPEKVSPPGRVHNH